MRTPALPSAIIWFCIVSWLAHPAVAGLRVWQTAVPQTPSSLVDQQGIGLRLNLRCDVTALPCRWLVTTQVLIEDGTLDNYSLEIRDPAGGDTDLSVSNTSVTGSLFSSVNFIEENPPAMPGYLSRISVGSTVGPVPPSVQFMHSYLLTMVDGQPDDFTNLIGRTDNFGGFEPANPGDPFRPVQMAANPSIQSGDWPNSVIRISHVPEPTSLSLLACALLALGCRNPRRR